MSSITEPELQDYKSSFSAKLKSISLIVLATFALQQFGFAADDVFSARFRKQKQEIPRISQSASVGIQWKDRAIGCFGIRPSIWGRLSQFTKPKFHHTKSIYICIATVHSRAFGLSMH